LARIEELNVSLIDDLDGGRATETIAFTLEAASYEIDRSKRNADKLRRSLLPYVESEGQGGVQEPQRQRKGLFGCWPF
jgi:hypothetical protein